MFNHTAPGRPGKADDRLIDAAFGLAAKLSASLCAHDVVDEVANNAFPLEPPDRQHLRSLGVLEAHFRSLFAAHVVLIGDRHFEWSPGVTADAMAVRAWVGFCHDVGGGVVDAWAWTSGSTVAVLWGRSVGVNSVREALRWRISEALAIYRTPLEWLIAGCVGVFVTDWRRAPFLLIDAGPLLARDVAHGEEIERHFAAVGLLPPPILVPSPVEAAA